LAHPSRTVHHHPLALWNAVDALRAATMAMTCAPVGLSPVHRPYHHHQILINIFSGESERHP